MCGQKPQIPGTLARLGLHRGSLIAGERITVLLGLEREFLWTFPAQGHGEAAGLVVRAGTHEFCP